MEILNVVLTGLADAPSSTDNHNDAKDKDEEVVIRLVKDNEGVLNIEIKRLDGTVLASICPTRENVSK